MPNININNEPATLVAAENPVFISLGTDASGSTEQYAITTIQVNSTGMTSGVDFVHINLTYPYTYGKRFNCSSSPSNPTDFIASPVTFIFTDFYHTKAQIANSIGQAIGNDPIISTYYNVYVDNETVYITSKLPLAKLTLATTTVITGGNNIINTSSLGSKFIVTTVQNGQSKYVGDYTANYAIWAEVFIDKTPTKQPFVVDYDYKDMNIIQQLKKPWIYNGENALTFNLENLLKGYVESPTPAYGTGFEGPFTDMIRHYKVRYGDFESLNWSNIVPLLAGMPNENKVYRGEITGKYVINSALPFTTENDMEDYYSGATYNKFLTASPSNKKVYLAQGVEYLYFVNNYYHKYRYPNTSSNSYTLKLYVTYNYIDGTSSSSTVAITSPTISPNYVSGSVTGDTKDGVYRVNVAPQHIGIDVSGYYSSKKVRGYTVYVYADGTTDVQLTLTKTYSIDDIQPTNGKEIMWLNEYGGHDTYYFSDTIITKLDMQQEEMIKNVPYNYPEGFEYNSIYNKQVTDIYTISSEYVNDETYSWFKSLINSNKVYLIENGRANYVKLTEHDYQDTTANNQNKLTITVQRTIFDNNISV